MCLRYLSRWHRSGSAGDRKTVAERDIRRLKWNWIFVALLCSMTALGSISPLSTIHQFIINPTREELNKTDQDMEPGLQQSESFYSWTSTAFFISFTITGILAGLLSNWIPYWYLFLSSILLHTVGFLLYALATNGWMMILARVLSGISMGSVVTLSFTYYGVSFEDYVENMRTLKKYEEKRAARVKGYVFSLFAVGNALGSIIGAGFPIIISYINMDHFRAVGWFNVAIGAAVFLLLLTMFHGEYKCGHDLKFKVHRKIFNPVNKKYKDFFCKFFKIPAYIIVVGGIQGTRFILAGVLLSPILSDVFGFSEAESAYVFLSYPIGQVIGSAIVIGLQYLKFSGFFLTASGMACSVASLLIMTDWEAIPHDPCTSYSLFHHPELADTYRMQLSESPHNVSVVIMDHLCIPQPVGENMWLQDGFYVQSHVSQWETHETSFRCNLSSTCHPCDASNAQTCTHFTSTKEHRICLNHDGSAKESEYVYGAENISQTFLLCTLQHQKHNSSSCFLLESEAVVESSSQSLLAEVHIQSLQVVESAVYEIAVNRCESVDDCHWIPNSQVTHKHCSDCQPICRSMKHTLNFVRFSIGLSFFFGTLPLMYTGTMLMLSNTVARQYQGSVTGCLITFMGIVRSTAPLWLDAAYERVQKRTFLPMLILVGLFLPLLIGLLLLYPWIRDRSKKRQSLDDHEEDNEGDEEMKLIPTEKPTSDSD